MVLIFLIFFITSFILVVTRIIIVISMQSLLLPIWWEGLDTILLNLLLKLFFSLNHTSSQLKFILIVPHIVFWNISATRIKTFGSQSIRIRVKIFIILPWPPYIMNVEKGLPILSHYPKLTYSFAPNVLSIPHIQLISSLHLISIMCLDPLLVIFNTFFPPLHSDFTHQITFRIIFIFITISIFLTIIKWSFRLIFSIGLKMIRLMYLNHHSCSLVNHSALFQLEFPDTHSADWTHFLPQKALMDALLAETVATDSHPTFH